MVFKIAKYFLNIYNFDKFKDNLLDRIGTQQTSNYKFKINLNVTKKQL